MKKRIHKLVLIFIFFAGAFALNAANEITISGSTGANASYSSLDAAFTAINNNANQSGNNITIVIRAFVVFYNRS